MSLQFVVCIHQSLELSGYSASFQGIGLGGGFRVDDGRRGCYGTAYY